MFFNGQAGHEITQRGFGTLVDVHVFFFQPVITSACTGVVNDLVQVVVAEEPVEGHFHFAQITILLKNPVKYIQRQYGIGHVYGLFAVVCFGLSFFVPGFVGNDLDAAISKRLRQQKIKRSLCDGFVHRVAAV